MSRRQRTRCGFVAVLGAPNAGKSTLVNALVGQKVAIVSQKVQTTRMPVRGIAMRGTAQIVFVDTPGIFAPKRRLDRAMVKAAWGGAADADAILVVVDAAGTGGAPGGLAAGDTERIVEGLKTEGKARRSCSTRSMRMKRDALLPLADTLNKSGVFDRIFMISAAKGDGLDELLDYCASPMPEGPLLYPEDQVADIPSRLLAAEITREKLYLRLHDELPYASDRRSPKAGRSRRTARFASTRPSSSNARARRGSSSARAGAPSRPSARPRGRRWRRRSAAGCIFFSTARSLGRWGESAGALSRMGPGIPKGSMS